MSISTQDLISFSEEVISNNNEICFRTAASRAYYSAYHVCKPIGDELLDPPYKTNPKGFHDVLIKKLASVNETSRDPDVVFARSLAHLLGRAKDFRRDADYDLNIDFKKSAAESTIEIAKEIDKIAKKINAKKLSNLQRPFRDNDD